MSSRRSLLLILLILGFGLCEAEANDEKAPHVVLVVGTRHYSPEQTMPLLAEELKRFGFRTTLVMGEGDPEKKTKNVLPGIEALKEADVAIFFLRFLKLPDSEWKYVEDYIKSGKPVIGLRTSNHAFKYPKDHPRYEWNDGFGRRVLGGPYVVHQSGQTEIKVVGKHRKHPIMTHVDKTAWTSPGTLYLTRLEGGCIPLVTGTGTGKARLVVRDWGTVQVHAEEADIVAWAWENEWGGKVFGTSFGHPGDFAEEAFTRMLVNSVFWATGKPVPAAEAKMPTWTLERADKKKAKTN